MSTLKMNLALTVSALALCAAAAAQDSLAVKAGKILTVAGPTLENAVVLVENGRITKLGKQEDVEIPWDARVVDASDKVVMPTYVLAHTSDGMRGANENLANVPYLTVADAVDPSDDFFMECLRNGVGTIHVIPGNDTLIGGQGMVVRPFGRTVEDMAVLTRSGIKLSLGTRETGTVAQIRKMRRALEDVREYLADYERRKAEFEEEKKAGAIPADKKWEEEYDKTKKPVIDLLARKITAYLYVPNAAVVDEARRLSQQFDAVLVLGRDAHKAAAQIAKLDLPVVLDDSVEYYEEDPETGDEELVCPPKVFADAGVRFAMSLGAGTPARYPWWQMAAAIRHGMDRKTAIESLTVVPAQILGLDDQVGSIAEGKMANLQILTGDPLQATTWVETVILEGEVVYERSKDPRLQYLFGRQGGQAGNR